MLNTNTLTTYERLMQEHEVIRANTSLIANSTDNLMTLSGLGRESLELTYHQVSYLSEKRVNLKRALTSLREGLIDHHNREEELLQHMVGDGLMQAIKREHQNILEKISEIDWILLNISPVGILFNSSFLKQKVDELRQAAFANSVRENSVYELLIKIPTN